MQTARSIRANFDVNAAIEHALNTTRLEWCDVAEISTDLDASLLPIPASEAELRLVFLNMVVNAAHAIAQVNGSEGPKGTIRIRTKRHGAAVEIYFEDDATQIPEAARAHVFDPSYVWEDGPGPWLAVAYNVVRRHGGSFAFESKPRRGTAFIILLPNA